MLARFVKYSEEKSCQFISYNSHAGIKMKFAQSVKLSYVQFCYVMVFARYFLKVGRIQSYGRVNYN